MCDMSNWPHLGAQSNCITFYTHSPFEGSCMEQPGSTTLQAAAAPGGSML